MTYILLYVDDIILIASFDATRKSIISLLSSEFAMKDLGSLSYFLCITVTRHAGGLFLSLRKYAAEIIEQASMSSCMVRVTNIVKVSALGGDLRRRASILSLCLFSAWLWLAETPAALTATPMGASQERNSPNYRDIVVAWSKEEATRGSESCE